MPSFRIAPIDGKGEGVLATRTIQPGELVLAEEPLFKAGIVSTEDSIARTVNSLSFTDREALLALSSGGRAGGKHTAIFSNNAFGLGDHASVAGLFLQGSKFNHSCRPNVSRVWDEGKGVELFIASAPIKEGEELCIYYTDPLQSKTARQAELKAKFGFDCTCETCSLPAAQSKESDVRRRAVQAIVDAIPHLINNPVPLVKQAKLGISLLEAEGLFVQRASLAYDAFNGCIGWSDVENAKKWRKKNLEYNELEVGKEGSEYKRIKKLLENPKRHMAYGIKGKKTVIGP
ncbi:hypothetical protein JCM11641_003732 [Rhodosporidiobolus odoratus]